MTEEERVNALAGLIEDLTARVDKQGGELMLLRAHISAHLHPCGICSRNDGLPE